MELSALLEDRAEKWPGYVKFAAFVAVIASLAKSAPDKEEGLTGLGSSALTIALAVFLYQAGSLLDDIVFDPLYSLKPSKPSRWLKRAWRAIARGIFFPVKMVADRLPGTKEMFDERSKAAEKIREEISGAAVTGNAEQKGEGIYEAAKTLLKDSEAWEEKVKPWLELSKTIRSFVWPLAAISLYKAQDAWSNVLLDDFLNKPVFNWFASWAHSLAAAFLALVLYVWLRAFHMRAMYKLLRESEYLPFPTGGPGPGERRTAVAVKHLSIGEAGSLKSEEPRAMKRSRKEEKSKEIRPIFLLSAIEKPSDRFAAGSES
jgi:hypothetical protein